MLHLSFVSFVSFIYSHVSRKIIRIKPWSHFHKKMMIPWSFLSCYVWKWEALVCSDSANHCVKVSILTTDFGACDKLCSLVATSSCLSCTQAILAPYKQLARWSPTGVHVGTRMCFRLHVSTDGHEATAKPSLGGSGTCLVGARRDAASCSHDWVRSFQRVVKSGRGCTLSLSPPTVLCWLVRLSLWISNSYHAVILLTARLRWKNAG